MVDMFNIKNENDWFNLYKNSPDNVKKFLREKFPQFYNKVKNTYETLDTLYGKGTTNLNDINKQVNNPTNRIKSGAQEFASNIKQGTKETINKGINAAKTKATEIGKVIPKSNIGKAAIAAKGLAKAVPLVAGASEIYDAIANKGKENVVRGVQGAGGALMMIPTPITQGAGLGLSILGGFQNKLANDAKNAELDYKAWKNTYTYPDGTPRLDNLAPELKPLTQEQRDRYIIREAENYDNITDPQRRAYIDAELPAAYDRWINSGKENLPTTNNSVEELPEVPNQFISYQTQPEGYLNPVDVQGNVSYPINNQPVLNDRQIASNQIQGNNTMNNNYKDIIEQYSKLLAQQQAANDIYKQEQVDYYNKLLDQYKKAATQDRIFNAINNAANVLSRNNKDIQYVGYDGGLKTINTGNEPLNLPIDTSTNRDRVLEQSQIELAKQELNKPLNQDADNYMKMLQMEELANQYGVSPAMFYGELAKINTSNLGQQALAQQYDQNNRNKAYLQYLFDRDQASKDQQWKEQQSNIKLQNDIQMAQMKFAQQLKLVEANAKSKQELEKYKSELNNNIEQQAAKLAGYPANYPSVADYKNAVNTIRQMITGGSGDNKELKYSWSE